MTCSETIFPIEEVTRVRHLAQMAAQVGTSHSPGWNKIEVDPEALVQAFAPLKVKTGVKLVAYQWSVSTGGRGIVWAIPEGGLCPDADGRAVEKPPGALEHVMDAIEGDGSAWSYLCASILTRELAELGAWWHGIQWNTHQILGTDPFGLLSGSAGHNRSGLEPTPVPDGWKLLEPRPKEWSPRVSEEGKDVHVTFYSFSELGKQAIYVHDDKYETGLYHPSCQRRVVAEGPPGFVH